MVTCPRQLYHSDSGVVARLCQCVQFSTTDVPIVAGVSQVDRLVMLLLVDSEWVCCSTNVHIVEPGCWCIIRADSGLQAVSLEESAEKNTMWSVMLCVLQGCYTTWGPRNSLQWPFDDISLLMYSCVCFESLNSTIKCMPQLSQLILLGYLQVEAPPGGPRQSFRCKHIFILFVLQNCIWWWHFLLLNAAFSVFGQQGVYLNAPVCGLDKVRLFGSDNEAAPVWWWEWYRLLTCSNRSCA